MSFSEHKIPIMALNPSAQEVYRLLLHRQLKVGEIQERTSYSPRTIRQAINKLVKLRLIRQLPDLHDLRSHYYTVTSN